MNEISMLNKISHFYLKAHMTCFCTTQLTYLTIALVLLFRKLLRS